MKQTFCLLYVFFFTFHQAYAQSSDLSVSSSNAHSYLEGYTPLGQYFQLSYAHPLNRTLSVTGHLSTAQRSHSNRGHLSNIAYLSNDMFSSVGLDVALRFHLINSPRHQFSLYVGGGMKRIASIDANSRMGLLILNADDRYDKVDLYRLPSSNDEAGYESGVGSYWMLHPYLAAEYMLYPTERLGIGYTMRVRSHLDYFFEDVSIGPVVRYRWADDYSERQYVAPSSSQVALQVIPSSLGSTKQVVTQLRTQYQRTVVGRWAVAGAVTYTQGSYFPNQWTPSTVADFYQNQSTAIMIATAYRLLADSRHQLTALLGPTYRWRAYATASNFVNAFDVRENRLYYDEALNPYDYPHLMGEFTTVRVDQQRGWGGNAQLNYTYQLASTVGVGGVIDYQQYTKHESLVGAGVAVSLHF